MIASANTWAEGCRRIVNVGVAICTIVVVLAKTPRSEIHSASYVFGTTINGTGWSSNSLSFLLGLLSVQWTMTGRL